MYAKSRAVRVTCIRRNRLAATRRNPTVRRRLHPSITNTRKVAKHPRAMICGAGENSDFLNKAAKTGIPAIKPVSNIPPGYCTFIRSSAVGISGNLY